MKREDEEYAKSNFDRYLLRKYSDLNIKWEEVEQQNEPPDYFVVLNGEKIAVEVTTLMEAVELGGKKTITFQGVINWMDEFVEEIEKIAMDQGNLRGAYMISFNRPIKNFGELKQKILLDILSYIHETKSFESASEKVVYKAPMLQKCTITKIHKDTNCVYRAGPTNAKWESESNEQLTDLINKSIHEKELKLSKIHSPKILLLLDKYLFSEFHELAEIEVPQDFYGVFSIRDGIVFEIYANNELQNIFNLFKY